MVPPGTRSPGSSAPTPYPIIVVQNRMPAAYFCGGALHCSRQWDQLAGQPDCRTAGLLPPAQEALTAPGVEASGAGLLVMIPN